MQEYQIPIVVAHGEGRAIMRTDKDKESAVMRYIDNNTKVTEKYPYNPNGSKIRILVSDIESIINVNHRLLSLCSKLPSNVRMFCKK